MLHLVSCALVIQILLSLLPLCSSLGLSAYELSLLDCQLFVLCFSPFAFGNSLFSPENPRLHELGEMKADQVCFPVLRREDWLLVCIQSYFC